MTLATTRTAIRARDFAPGSGHVTVRREYRLSDTSPAARRGEEMDTYPGIVAVLGDRWRVIVCKAGIQWVLQVRRSGPDSWRGRSFCCTREALVRTAREHAGDIAADALVILLRLPERIGGDA